MPIDLSAFFPLLPGIETVSLKAGSSYVPVRAKMFRSSTQEAAPSNGIYCSEAASWELSTLDLDTVTPKPGDQIITSDARVYVIQGVTNPVFNDSYLVSSLHIYLEPTRIQRVTITLPKDSADMFASPITRPGLAASQVEAVIQETSNEIVDFQGKKGMRRHYNIYTYSCDDLPLGTIISDSAGKRYVVQSTEEMSRIDRLMVIHAIVNP